LGVDLADCRGKRFIDRRRVAPHAEDGQLATVSPCAGRIVAPRQTGQQRYAPAFAISEKIATHATRNMAHADLAVMDKLEHAVGIGIFNHTVPDRARSGGWFLFVNRLVCASGHQDGQGVNKLPHRAAFNWLLRVIEEEPNSPVWIDRAAQSV
jgi:hypothetical protein